MPFMLHGRALDQPHKDLVDIDRVVLQLIPSVEGSIIDFENGHVMPIYPNSNIVDKHETGARLYFATLCMQEGLILPDVGAWLDENIHVGVRVYADGKRRLLTAQQESVSRFDKRKPRYVYDGVSRYHLEWLEL